MDLTQLENNILAAMAGNGKKALGTTSQDLTGVPFTEVMQGGRRIECASIKWLNQNNPWGVTFKTFIELGEDGGTQGVRAYNGQGNVVKEISSEIYGGVSGDPMKAMDTRNRQIIGEVVKYVISQI